MSRASRRRLSVARAYKVISRVSETLLIKCGIIVCSAVFICASMASPFINYYFCADFQGANNRLTDKQDKKKPAAFARAFDTDVSDNDVSS